MNEIKVLKTEVAIKIYANISIFHIKYIEKSEFDFYQNYRAFQRSCEDFQDFAGTYSPRERMHFGRSCIRVLFPRKFQQFSSVI